MLALLLLKTINFRITNHQLDIWSVDLTERAHVIILMSQYVYSELNPRACSDFECSQGSDLNLYEECQAFDQSSAHKRQRDTILNELSIESDQRDRSAFEVESQVHESVSNLNVPAPNIVSNLNVQPSIQKPVLKSILKPF